MRVHAIYIHALEAVSLQDVNLAISRVPFRLQGIVAGAVKNTNSWSTQANIVGFGISRKSIGGKPASKLAIVIYVKKKLDRGSIEDHLIVPRRIQFRRSYPVLDTDVVQLGFIRACIRQERVRPAAMGHSISHFSQGAGTLTAVLSKNGVSYLFSCEHVLAPRSAAMNDPIVQPGVLDDENWTDNVVASLRGRGGLTNGPGYPNLIDVALASEIRPGALQPSNVSLEQLVYARRDMQVHFDGRSSGLSNGVILDTHFRCYLSIHGKPYGYRRQILTSCTSLEGDSGSLLLSSNNRPLGILIGGSKFGSVFCPLTSVRGLLDRGNLTN